MSGGARSEQPTAPEVAMENARYRAVEKLSKLPAKHEKTNESLRSIRSQSERFVTNGKVTQQVKLKLSGLYEAALKSCQTEAEAIRKILAEIRAIRQAEFELVLNSKMSRGQMINVLSEQAKTLPLYVATINEFPPAGVGAIAYANKSEIAPNTVVAAFVDDVWILAMVLNQNSHGKYDIRDIDDESSRRIAIRRAYLIPLPEFRADPQRDAHALFPVDAIVLALYPQTTCFYKGVVDRQPQNANDDYHIAFEDNTFDSGYSPSFAVAQRYVIMHKPLKTREKAE
ncbi:SGF29 C-terminal domain-containing protein [Aphelenchoides fujianensis]|nr:SGF29 C-terminal domain-containing protein [Aphelenchoides fujianensis]